MQESRGSDFLPALHRLVIELCFFLYFLTKWLCMGFHRHSKCAFFLEMLFKATKAVVNSRRAHTSVHGASGTNVPYICLLSFWPLPISQKRKKKPLRKSQDFLCTFLAQELKREGLWYCLWSLVSFFVPSEFKEGIFGSCHGELPLCIQWFSFVLWFTHSISFVPCVSLCTQIGIMWTERQ